MKVSSITCPVCESKEEKKQFGAYIKCCVCWSLFLEDFPAKKQIQKLSDEDADVIFDTDEDKIAVMHTDRLKDLAQYIPRKCKILDVGCGNGIFLKCAAKDGYIPFAMDIAPKIVQHLQKDGIQGYTTMEEIPSKSFEAITAFDVIEHTTQPKEFVQQIKAKLKKSGIIMFTTPNMRGISGTVLKTRWWVFGPDGHYVLFSPYSLQLLLEKNGFEIVSLKTDSFTQWFVPNNTLSKKFVNKVIYMIYTPLKKYLNKHNFGDNIQIIAKVTNQILL